LVVEDDRELAALYAEWLEGRYDVETAHGGAEALERLDGTVDVVLLDRMMPGLSGGEVLERIRDAEVDPRVVMVSAVTPDLDIVKMGFDAYVEKPVEEATLHETVDRMLTRAEYDQKLQELFSLIERQETLDAVKRADVLETSEEYRSLTDRLETVQREVESLFAELPDEDFRVAVERLQRTAVERTSERRYESLTEDVLDSSREATVVVDADGAVVWANRATETLLGVDREGLRGREYATVAADHFEPIEAGETSLASLVRTGLSDQTAQLDATVHVPRDTGTERWLEYWSAPIETGLYAGGRIEHYHDITGRHRREQYLQTLHRETRTLMTADTDEDVTSHAVTTATEALDFPYAAVFTRDEVTGNLVPTASDTTDAVGPTLPTLSGGTDPVWTVYTDRTDRLGAETHRARDGTDGSGAWLEDAFDDWMLCPVGRRGVFLVATTDGRSLSATQRTLAETWAANTRQALEQLARTRNLRDRDRELERQNERLSRLDRVNRLIRSIGPAVAGADTRAEIETEVCRHLLRMAPVTGVWVADVDLSTDATVCRAQAGLDDYLADVPRVSSTTDGPGPGATPAVPARQAYETRSWVSVTDLVTVESDVWWRQRGLRRGTNAVIAVPIVHGSTRFGAIEVHVDRPTGMSDEEVDAIAELGVTVGHAIGAIRQRDALLSGGDTYLTFRVDSDSRLSRFVAGVDAPVTVTDVSRRDDGTCAVFVTVETGRDTDRDRVETQVENTTGASVLRTDTTETSCVLTLGPEAPTRRLVGLGAALHEVAIRPDSEQLAVTVQLPYETEVREYVDTVTDTLDGVELVAQRHRSVDRQPSATVASAVDDRLTDRQRETLRMAFHAGYFDWPRSADANTVAGELDIAQSTFSQHLRVAERKLLEELFS
jgi:PAS domain S-box-containing protein